MRHILDSVCEITIKGQVSLTSDAIIMVIKHNLNQLYNPGLLYFPNHQDIFSSFSPTNDTSCMAGWLLYMY